MRDRISATASGGRAAGRIAGPLRSGARALLMASWTAALTNAAVGLIGFYPRPSRTARIQRWAQLWARGLLSVFGVEQRWAGEPAPTARKARLVVANHRSPLDIILMLQRFGGSVLARHDLERWPVLGRAARQGGTIFVNRDDANSGLQAIREIRRRLAAGQTVIVFPEGTTQRGDTVLPFRGGAFAALRGLDVELIPVGIAYEPGSEFIGESFPQYLYRMSLRTRTRVGLCAGRARPALGNREAIAAEMQRDVQALVAGARAALNGEA
jgi:1-acyl-sn-glycerol-3-phosphate acyltransferase